MQNILYAVNLSFQLSFEVLSNHMSTYVIHAHLCDLAYPAVEQLQSHRPFNATEVVRKKFCQ